MQDVVYLIDQDYDASMRLRRGARGVDVAVESVLLNKVRKIILHPMVSPRRPQRESVPKGIPCQSTPF